MYTYNKILHKNHEKQNPRQPWMIQGDFAIQNI